jgi:hypothetical protein
MSGKSVVIPKALVLKTIAWLAVLKFDDLDDDKQKDLDNVVNQLKILVGIRPE